MKRFRRFQLLLAAVVLPLVAGATADADPVFPPGWEVYSVPAEADSYIHNGDLSDENFGGAALLMGKWFVNDVAYSRKAYIRFDVRTEVFPIPNEFFQLTLNVVDSGTGGFTAAGNNHTWEFGVYGFYGTGNEWSEEFDGVYDDEDPTTGITWNNAPFNVVGSGSAMVESPEEGDGYGYDGAVPLGTFDIVGKGIGNVIAFRSQALNDFINATPETEQYLNFVITRNTREFGGQDYVHAFASREYDNKGTEYNKDGYLVEGPFLSSIPEPATAMIWAVLGLLCVVGQWRWR